MNLYAKLKELEDEIKKNGAVEFETPYKKVRKIVGVNNGEVLYEHKSGRVSAFDIDVLYADYLLLKALGHLNASSIKKFNKRYKNGNKPCNVTTFMLLMEYFFGCKFIRGAKNNQSEIIWQ